MHTRMRGSVLYIHESRSEGGATILRKRRVASFNWKGKAWGLLTAVSLVTRRSSCRDVGAVVG